MYQMEKMFNSVQSVGEYYSRYCEHLSTLLQKIDIGAFSQVVSLIEQKIELGKTLFLAGNGGSSAVLSHWVNDLVVGNYMPSCKPIKAVNLTDNVSSVTALGNDEGYENVFVGQLRALAEAGDLLIAMSVSGNSPNILKAVDWAVQHDVDTVGIAGCDGGQLLQRCRYKILFESTKDEYGPVEDAFSILTHCISTYLAQKRGKKLYH